MDTQEEFKIEFEKRLKMYQERCTGNSKPDCIAFFVYNDGDEPDHLLVYQEQIPAIRALTNQYPPYFVIVRELGRTLIELGEVVEENG